MLRARIGDLEADSLAAVLDTEIIGLVAGMEERHTEIRGEAITDPADPRVPVARAFLANVRDELSKAAGLARAEEWFRMVDTDSDLLQPLDATPELSEEIIVIGSDVSAALRDDCAFARAA
jgi:hypothetical protein